MKAQLKDTPSQWVSINNRAKSKKQKQTIIEMTDEGAAELEDDAADDGKAAKPVKTTTQQRKPPTPKPAEEQIQNRPGAEKPKLNRNNDSNSQNKPLAATPVERMPPMPE